MASTNHRSAHRDRIRELFYEAIEGFPAELRDKAELWLYEREVSQTMLEALERLASLRHRRGLGPIRRCAGRISEAHQEKKLPRVCVVSTQAMNRVKPQTTQLKMAWPTSISFTKIDAL